MSKTVIFDWDHTIFNTKKFKEDLFGSLLEFGFSYKTIEQAYRESMKKNKKFMYDYDSKKHLEILENKKSFILNQAEGKFNKVIKKSSQYLFKGTKFFLNKLKSRGYRLILISRGNPSFNKQKIKHSGIANFFDKIYVFPEPKNHVLTKVFNKKIGLIWYVNDNYNELLWARNRFPQVKYALRDRPDHPKIPRTIKRFNSYGRLLKMMS